MFEKAIQRKRAHGGAALPHRKNTAHQETEMLPLPDAVTILLSQNIGPPCKPLVAVGDFVKTGQKIGDGDSPLSVPIHASITGTVHAIKPVENSLGKPVESITIKRASQEVLEPTLAPPTIHSYADFLKAVRESGIVGLGGAGFPTAVKLKPADLSKIDCLLINGAECEPYLTSDYREMMENTEAIVSGVTLLKKWLGISRILIGVEKNKPLAIQRLSEAFADDAQTSLCPLESHYPQGAEKTLIYTLTGRTVPEGKLPADAGVIVLNITTLAAIADYVRTGIPFIQKRLTIDGGAIASPKNVRAPIGTPLSDLVRFCGGYKTEPRKLILGGPMMGHSLSSDQFYTVKANGGLLALSLKEADPGIQTNCIHCGKCVYHCPMSLLPTEFERCADQHNVKRLRHLKVNLCIECGTCSYVCPARRDLVAAIRKGKAILLEQKNEKGEK